MATSIEAARRGYGFSWYPEEKVRDELAAGTLSSIIRQSQLPRSVFES